MGNFLKSKVGIYTVSVFSVLLWGLSYLWSDKLMLLGINVEYAVCVRSFIAGLVLLAVSLLMGHSIKIHKKDIKLFILLSVFEPLIYFTCETYGIKLTESPTYSALIIATAPILSTIAGVTIFKEKVSWINIIGIIICLGGPSVVTRHASGVGEYFVVGIIMLIVAVVAEVGYAVCTKKLSESYRPQIIVMYQFLLGGVLLIPLMLTRGMENFDAALYFSWDVWEPILCLAVLCSSLAFTLWASTIKNLGVAKASVFLAMIPVITAIAGYITGREVLCFLQWAGIGLSFTGLVLTQFAKK